MFELSNQYFIVVNIAIIVFYVFSFLMGYKKGLLRQCISLIGTLVCLFLAYRYGAIISEYIPIWPKSLTPLQDTLLADFIYEYANKIAWVVFLFIALRLVVFILETIVKQIQNFPVLRQTSQLLGGLVGLISATIWLFLIGSILNGNIFSNGLEVSEKTLFKPVNQVCTSVFSSFGIESQADFVNEVVKQSSKLDIQNKDIDLIRNFLEKQNKD